MLGTASSTQPSIGQSDGFMSRIMNLSGSSRRVLDEREAYKGNNFLKKPKGEEDIQILLAKKMIEKSGVLTPGKPVKVVDIGCGSGRFTQRLYTDSIITPNSIVIAHDTEIDQCHHAATTLTQLLKDRFQIKITNTPEDLFNCVQGQRANFAFLNMVDVCQPNMTMLLELFKKAADCLEKEGRLFIITQNPMARGIQHKYYKTRFAHPRSHGLTDDDAQLITSIEGLDADITDYGRPLESTIGGLINVGFNPQIVATMDDEGTFLDCELSNLSKISTKDNRRCAAWCPSVTDTRQLTIVCLDKSGNTINLDVPPEDFRREHVRININAPYIGIMATLR